MRSMGLAAVLAAAILVPASVSAQSGQGAIVSGGAAATAIESGTRLSIVGSVGYRFNPVISFGLEITSVPTLTPNIPAALRDTGLVEITNISGFGGSSTLVYSSRPSSLITYSDEGGRAVVFTTNARFEVPTVARRIIPYAVAGGGVAHLRETYTVHVSFPPIFLEPPPGFPFTQFPRSELPARRISGSSTDVALTLGGGAGFLVTERISVDADLRYVRTLGERDRNIGRFGLGASYRF
jgi:opacity protein-like surface antigen